MNDLGPIKTIIKANHTENVGSRRVRVGKSIIPLQVPLKVEQQVENDYSKLAVKEYQYVPPAAKRFYLWDSTPIGQSFLSIPKFSKGFQLNFTAINSCLSLIERHGFKEPGFFIGNIMDSIVIFDRFDMGRNNKPTMVMKGDEILKIFFALDQEKEYFRNLILQLENYVSSTTVILFLPWIINIQLKEEELEISTTRIIPKTTLRYVGIPSIRIVPNALISDLLVDSQEIRFGYMAIDQARHVVFIRDDAVNSNWCLIGMWVKGVQDIKDEIIQKLSVFYLMNQVLPKVESSKSFLICCYSKDSRFYQVNYEFEKDDFILQKAQLNVSAQNSNENIMIDFMDVDIGREKSFCESYKAIRGVYVSLIQLFSNLEIIEDLQTTPDPELIKEEELTEKEELTNQNTTNVTEAEAEPSKEEPLGSELIEDNIDRKTEDYKDLQNDQIQKFTIPSNMNDSQNQQWVYLTLLQQQIDILRTQMMHLLNKENNSQKVSVSTNTEVLYNHDFGMNTSFAIEVPEQKDQSIQVSILEDPIEVIEKLETYSEIPNEEVNVDTDSKPPYDTGSNYRPFFSISKVEESTKEEIKDSPETTFSKSMIAQLAQNPNESFIYVSDKSLREKEISQELPDGSSMNTTLMSAGHSFATQEYLRRHGLLNDTSTISTVPMHSQNSIFLKPARQTSDFKVLDSMRLKALEINTKAIKDENLRLLADSFLYIGDATLDFTAHQFKYLPPDWVKKSVSWRS